MNMLYNSDSFSVLEIEWPAAPVAGVVDDEPHVQGGYEIVDKLAGKGLFRNGDLARSFREGAQALSEKGVDEDAVEDFIAHYAGLAQQPMVLH
jgi:hypothetical protein